MSLAEDFELHRRARLGVAMKLGYHKVVREHAVKKGWPEDEDLLVVLACALACRAQNAGGQRFRRPPAADALGDLWPATEPARTSSRIIEKLELEALVTPR